jgi:hypothetical protein
MAIVFLGLLALWLIRVSEGVMILGVVLILMAGLQGIFQLSVMNLVTQLDVLKNY